MTTCTVTGGPPAGLTTAGQVAWYAAERERKDDARRHRERAAEAVAALDLVRGRQHLDPDLVRPGDADRWDRWRRAEAGRPAYPHVYPHRSRPVMSAADLDALVGRIAADRGAVADHFGGPPDPAGCPTDDPLDDPLGWLLYADLGAVRATAGELAGSPDGRDVLARLVRDIRAEVGRLADRIEAGMPADPGPDDPPPEWVEAVRALDIRHLFFTRAGEVADGPTAGTEVEPDAIVRAIVGEDAGWPPVVDDPAGAEESAADPGPAVPLVVAERWDKARPAVHLFGRPRGLGYTIWKVLHALAGHPDGMTKDAIEGVAPNARRLLNELLGDRTDGSDWRQVIVMPGRKGNGGYRLRLG